MKKIVEKLADMGLITYMGVEANKFKTVDELIDSGVITTTIDRNKIYEIIGEQTPNVVDIVEPIKTEPIVEEVEVVEEPIVEEVVEPIVEEPKEEIAEIIVDEESVVEEKPKTKKSNKKSE